VEVEGQDLPAGGGHRVRVASVAPGFFEALHTPILAGRTLDGRDVSGPAATVIANATFVDTILGGQHAIGRRVRYRADPADGPAGPWMEIVGVVGRLGMRSLAPDRDEGLYVPLGPDAATSVRLAIEGEGPPMALAPRVQEIARAIDPAIVVAAPTTLDRVFEGDWYVMTAAAGGAALLVGVLLALAVCGLYAIMSFTISERTREIGIRMALGADRRRIAVHVARRAVVQIGVGVLVGLPFAAGIFFEMQESGPSPSALVAVGLALAQGITVLVLVALAACFVPTRRALRISPVEALRGDG
jgi:putative ABC transport system permease protein